MKIVIQSIVGLIMVAALPVFGLSVQSDTMIKGALQVPKTGVSVTSQSNVGSTMDTAEAKSDTSVAANAALETNLEPIVIHANDADTHADASVISAEDVTSNTQLHSYVRAIIKSDANIADASASSESVSVSHREHARAFWIFPITVFAHATIHSNGSVNVSYPWYVFAGSMKSELENSIRVAVRSSIPSVDTTAQAHVQLSSRAQAAILEKTAAVLKTQLEAEETVQVKAH